MRSLLLSVAITATVQTAAAADVERLAGLLVPTFTAMSFAGLCEGYPGWSAEEPRGPHGGAIRYAEHAKREIVSGLSDGEAMIVQRYAAERAAAEAWKQVNAVAIAGPAGDVHQRHLDWCRGAARQFIAEVIRDHDRNHGAFEREVAAAKRSKRP